MFQTAGSRVRIKDWKNITAMITIIGVSSNGHTFVGIVAEIFV